jgi:hypothetical protein
MEFVFFFIGLGMLYRFLVHKSVGAEILFEGFFSVDSGILVDLRLESALIFV